MKRLPGFIWLALAATVFFAACDVLTGADDVGGLQIRVHRLSNDSTSLARAAVIDAARARIIGPAGDNPTTRTAALTLRNGTAFIDTVIGLQPGTYTVALEGISGGSVEEFGETSGVSVTGGDNTVANVGVRSFRPATLTAVPIADSLAMRVTIGSVQDASEYVVSWSSDSLFASSTDTTIAGTTVRIDVPTVGRFYARARAINAYQAAGVWSDSAGADVDIQAASVNLTPGAQTLTALDDSLQLIAVALDAGGNAIPGKTFTWTATAGSAITVDSMGLVIAVGEGMQTVSALVDLVSGTADVTVDQLVEAIVVTAPADTISAGMNYQFSAAATDRRNNAIQGQGFAWQTSDSSIASVDATGLVSGVSGGNVTVSAFADGKQGDKTVYLLPLTASVAVLPVSNTLDAIQDTVRFTAAALESNGDTIPNKPIVWAVSDSTVAQIDANGLLTALANGTTDVFATADTATGMATLTVSQVAAQVTVSAPSDTLFLGVPTSFTAEARDALNNLIPSASFSWTSTDSAIATVDSAGVVTGVAGGVVSIEATADSVTGSTAVFFWPQAAVVNVSPTLDSLTALTDTTRFAAVAEDAVGDTIPGKQFAWSSSDSSVVGVDSTGLVTAIANGTASVIAMADSVVDSAMVVVSQVVASLGVSSPFDTLFVNGFYQFTASPEDANGFSVTNASLTWGSTDTSVVSVDPVGVVEAKGSGSAQVWVSSNALADSISIVSSAASAPSVGLLAHFPFDGHPHDVVSAGHYSTVNGATLTQDRFGQSASAYAFDGVNNSISLGDWLKPQLPLTVSIWLSVNDTASATQFNIYTSDISWYTAWAGGWLFAIDSGRVRFSMGNGRFNFQSQSRLAITDDVVLRTSQWHHVAVVVEDITTVTIYVDGVPRAHTLTGNSPFMAYQGGVYGGTFGSQGGQEYFDGAMDDFRVYDRALSPYEVSAMLADRFMTPVGDSAVITVDSANVEEGRFLQADATVFDMMGTPIFGRHETWESSDSSILRVDSMGLIEAYTPGSAYVKASLDAATDSVLVTVSAPSVPFSMISAGRRHSCGIAQSGETYCWGLNSNGELGDASTTTSLVPVAVSGLDQFAIVEAGARMTCAVDGTNVARCWGHNNVGQVGDSTTTNRITPTLVSGAHSFDSISSGYAHSCGLVTGGLVRCWGWGAHGAIGNSGGSASLSYPDSVSGPERYTNVEAGFNTVCAVAVGGDGFCWGRDNTGQLGGGGAGGSDVPVPVSGGIKFRDIVTGGDPNGGTTCGIDSLDTGYCWGRNTNGQVGDGSTTQRLLPVPIAGGLSWSELSVGGYHVCGLTTSGQAYCWGYNGDGELGDGTTTDRDTPTAVFGGRTFVSITAGEYHTCAISAAGAAYCWGSGTDGRRGDGTTGDALFPVRIQDP